MNQREALAGEDEKGVRFVVGMRFVFPFYVAGGRDDVSMTVIGIDRRRGIVTMAVDDEPVAVAARTGRP